MDSMICSGSHRHRINQEPRKQEKTNLIFLRSCFPNSIQTMNRLEEILLAKRDEIERLKPRLAELDRQARARTDFRDFRAALESSGEKLSVVAEIKKASPSAGVIAESFDPVEIAKKYEQAGAKAISVFTDK